MFEQTYDIIDWKSCETYSLRDSSTDDKKNIFGIRGVYPFSRDDIASTTDIIFPKLFHDQESETSIVSIPDEELDFGPLQFHTGLNSEQTVYQKVANWVLTQRNYFRNVDDYLEDDEIEVIDPVDLFHESNLNDYLLITEDESERRVLLRDFESHRYRIQSAEEAMKTNEYRFLRKPKCGIELELKRIVDLHKFHKTINPKHLRKRRDSSSTISLISQSTALSNVEETEEQLKFLGVPRLLDSYVILNREGYVIKEDQKTDLWLSPLEVGLVAEVQHKPTHNCDIDFMSSWFSDVYQTDLNTDEVRTLVTDIMEKATVISVSNVSEEEVWVDAPNIPHWFDDEQEELELFNQPSRPLYYYRDRIKGCYRIIGVEDETVVLFSGNDDDTIFYPGDDITNETLAHTSSNGWTDGDRLFNNTVRFRRSDSDRKTDSGIEDIDDIISEDVAIASIEVSKDQHSSSTECFPEKTKNVAKLQLSEKSLIEILFVLVALVTLFVAILLPTSSLKIELLPISKNKHDDNVMGKFLSKLKDRHS